MLPAGLTTTSLAARSTALQLFGKRVLASILAVSAPGAATAQEGLQGKIISEGKEDYDIYCAACHGTDGRGGGAMAKILVKPPADLTGISAANKGEFPFWRVFKIIGGDSPVAGHETFQMPRFWERMRVEDFQPGYHRAHIRVLLLTHFVESLQKK